MTATPVRDRKLIRWVAGYAAAAWVALQGVDFFADMWAWPAWVGRVAFVALATGLGVTLVLAWFHGERGRQRVSMPEGVLLVLLVAGGGLGVAAVLASGEEGPSEAGRAAVAVADAGTLAVLPFDDLSPGGGRAYLGDGIAETLISNLARIEALKVVARTSAFAFRDSEDVRDIGRSLGAGTIVEGTVAQIGSRVRITASLIDASTGESLWAERFDDEVEEAELFDLQDDVARRIVDALRVRLGEGERIVRGGSQNPEAQRAYFLGLHHWTLRTTSDMVTATGLFHDAISADSTYSDAWGGLALAYVLSTPQEYAVPGIGREEALSRAEAAASRALELDPDLPSAYAALGDAAVQRGDLDQGERRYREAIRRSPGYATAHHWLADLLMMKLDGEGALAEIEIAGALDPVAPAILVERAEALMILGRREETSAQMEKAIGLHPDGELVRSFALYFWMRLGEWDRAAEQVWHLARISGMEDVGDELRLALVDPDRRRATLESLQRIVDATEVGIEGTDIPRWGTRSGSGAFAVQLMRRPEMRFLLALELRGMDRALDLLEELATGPSAAELYPPVFPALIGPEALATERARDVMRVVIERR